MAAPFVFAPFITLGRYFFMGGADALPCAPKDGNVDQILPEFSTFGGSQQQVIAEDVSLNDLNEAMSFWWLLAGIKFSISADGTYGSNVPPSPRDWNFNYQIVFPGVRAANSLTGKPVNNPSFKILDCQTQEEVSWRDLESEILGGQSWDKYTHLMPFYGTDNDEDKNNPSFFLAEFFAYIEPLIPPAFEQAPITNSGLVIISTRNKDYTDVVLEGNDGGLETVFVGQKQITVEGFDMNIPFYANLFILNSNAGKLTVSNFDVQYVSKEVHISK